VQRVMTKASEYIGPIRPAFAQCRRKVTIAIKSFSFRQLLTSKHENQLTKHCHASKSRIVICRRVC